MNILLHNSLDKTGFRVIGKEIRLVRVLSNEKNSAKLKKLLFCSKNLPFDKSKIDSVILKNEGYVFNFKVLDLFVEFKALNRPSFYERREVILFTGVDNGKKPVVKTNVSLNKTKNGGKVLPSSVASVFVSDRER